jgi:hypothetical protein
MRPAPSLHTRRSARATSARALLGALCGLGLTLAAGRAHADAGGPQFRLPWGSGASQYLTQDANDACCSDHVGANKYAFDFALPEGGAFDVVAPAAGTIVHVKMSSAKGCGDPGCVSDANYVVIDHGDGTQTTMLHLAQGSLDPSLTCGGFVRRGQRVATTGSTGWSTGVHLHVERDQVKRDLKKICECGPDGSACAPSQVEWGLFWPSTSQPNLPVDYEEWKSASSPDNRRGLIGPSKNADERDEIAYVEPDGRTSLLSGEWSDAKDGGRRGGFKWARASGKPSALVSLDKAGLRAGTYEVWAFVPLSLSGGEATYELRGADGGDVRGTLSQAGSGGSFRPIRGLERVRFAATGKESLALAATGEETQKLGLDGLLFRRVGDLDGKAAKAAARASERSGLVGFELDGRATRAIGGGAPLPSPRDLAASPARRVGWRDLGLPGAGVAGAAFVGIAIAATRRRRSRA